MTLTGSSRGAGSNEWTNSMPQSTEPRFPRGSKYPFITALGFLFVGFSAPPFAGSVRIALALIGLAQFLLGMIGWVFLDKLERYPSGPDQPWSEDGGLYPGPIGPRDGEPRPPHAHPGPIRWRALDEGYPRGRSRRGSGIRRPYRRTGNPIRPVPCPAPIHQRTWTATMPVGSLNLPDEQQDASPKSVPHRPPRRPWAGDTRAGDQDDASRPLNESPTRERGHQRVVARDYTAPIERLHPGATTRSSRRPSHPSTLISTSPYAVSSPRARCVKSISSRSGEGLSPLRDSQTCRLGSIGSHDLSRRRADLRAVSPTLRVGRS
jgi:hypothetical protein